MANPKTLPDLADRASIELLINTFYERVQEDELLGFIFTDVAKVNWEKHLPKMYSFWETVIFRTGGYRGDPLGAHAKFKPLTEMGKAQFDQWLIIFKATVDDLFAGENADHIKNAATDMANVLYSKVNNVPDPRFEPNRSRVE